MKVHAQSTTTLAESRVPYFHLGYTAASYIPDLFVLGAVLVLGYWIASKVNYRGLIGGIVWLLRRFRNRSNR